MKKGLLLIVSLVFLLGSSTISIGQRSAYLPKGDPSKWNVEITPYVWLPVISGEISSIRLSEEFNVPAVDLLSNGQ